MMRHLVLGVLLGCSVQAWGLECSKPIDVPESVSEAIYEIALKSNEKGDVGLIWAGASDRKESLYFSFKPVNSEWTSPEIFVPSEEAGFYPSYDFKVDPTGKCSLGVAIGDYSKRSYLVVSKRGNDSWSDELKIESPELSLSDIKLTCDGGVVSVGQAESVKDNDKPWEKERTIQVIRSLPNELPLTLERVSTSPLRGYDENIKIFTNEEGLELVVWGDKDYLSDTLSIVSAWNRGGSWETQHEVANISQAYIGCCGFAGAVDRHGNAVVCWPVSVRIGQGNYREYIQAVTCSEGVWSQVVDFGISGPDAERPKCAISRDGHAILVYEDDNGDKISAAFKPKGEDWIASTHFPFVKGMNFAAEIQPTSDGDFVVVWVNKLKNRFSVYGTVFSVQTKTWEAPVLLSPLGASCRQPKIALTSAGHGMIAWEMSNGFDDWVQVAELTY